VTITPIEADTPASPSNLASGRAFLRVLSGASEAFARADASERAFIGGHGGLLPMIIDRAQADIVLSIASAAASRAAQAVTTVFNMQV
jgi:hypothetical protein